MTDKAETKVREWALHRNGDPLTPHDAMRLILAVDEDSVARHNALVSIFEAHCGEAAGRESRISALELWRRDSAVACRHW